MEHAQAVAIYQRYLETIDMPTTTRRRRFRTPAKDRTIRGLKKEATMKANDLGHALVKWPETTDEQTWTFTTCSKCSATVVATVKPNADREYIWGAAYNSRCSDWQQLLCWEKRPDVTENPVELAEVDEDIPDEVVEVVEESDEEEVAAALEADSMVPAAEPLSYVPVVDNEPLFYVSVPGLNGEIRKATKLPWDLYFTYIEDARNYRQELWDEEGITGVVMKRTPGGGYIDLPMAEVL